MPDRPAPARAEASCPPPWPSRARCPGGQWLLLMLIVAGCAGGAPVPTPAGVPAGRGSVGFPANAQGQSQGQSQAQSQGQLPSQSPREKVRAAGTPRGRLAAGPQAPAATAANHGTLTVVYDTPTTAAQQAIKAILAADRVFDDLAAGINADFKLPYDITVHFETCDDENAYYDADTHTVMMCYELIERYKALFTDAKSPPEEVESAVVDAGVFTFMHELGHALVDAYQLPITGREEDAVDEFATILLLEHGAAGEEAALAAVDQFAADAEDSMSAQDDLAYWDEHSLDAQRLSSTLCLIYGSDPARHKDLIDDQDLPAERAETCPDEYLRKSHAWSVLLEPHLKPGTHAAP